MEKDSNQKSYHVEDYSEDDLPMRKILVYRRLKGLIERANEWKQRQEQKDKQEKS